jgi:hypothetical protein
MLTGKAASAGRTILIDTQMQSFYSNSLYIINLEIEG